MSSVIIRKKELVNFGRKLMKEVYEHVHDSYMITFDEVKKERKDFEKYLTKFYYKNKYEFELSQKETCSSTFNKILGEINPEFIQKIEEYEKLDEIKLEKLLKEIEGKIKNESLHIDVIFDVLNRLHLNNEIDEDLYYEKKAFIKIYEVHKFDYFYLDK